MSYEKFPPLQPAETYNLKQVQLDEAPAATLTPFAALACELGAFVDACAALSDRSR